MAEDIETRTVSRRHGSDPGAGASPSGPSDAELGGDGVGDTIFAMGGDGQDARPREAAERFGRYVVLGKLGAGGMGEVFAAWDPELDRRIALKRLRLAPEDGRRVRLLREAQAMAKLRHPNVIAVHDVGRLEGEVFIAMEYVEGQTLREWIGQGRTWQETVAAFVQAARGLAAAHAEGLVHRDFKPDNAMIGRDGRVQVLDFGLVAAVGDAVAVPEDSAALSGSSALRSPITATGTVMGTPAYMAPEQFLGEPTDARTDQFALCVALWEALHGHRPFQGATFATLSERVITGQMEPESGRAVPAWLRQVVRRGLASDPEERYPDMTSLIAGLSHSAVGGKTRRLALAGAGLALATAAGGYWWADSAGARKCADAAAPVQALWSEERRQSLANAFAATDLSYAEVAWNEAAVQIDKRAEALGGAFVEACHDTHVAKTQSAALLDRRRVCLDDKVDFLRKVLTVLGRTEPIVVEHALEVAETIPDGSRCTAARAMLAQRGMQAVPTPQAVSVRADLNTAEALRTAGLLQDARERVDASLLVARELGDPTLLVSALTATATVLADSEEPRRVEQLLDEAYPIVRELDDDDLLMPVLQQRIRNALDRDQFQEGLRLATLMDHEMRRAGRNDLRAYVEGKRGLLQANLGHYDLAIEHYQAALTEYEAHGLQASSAATNTRANLGTAYMWAERLDDARRELTAAHEALLDRFGADHPILSASWNNLSVLAGASGDKDKAMEYARQSLRICEAAYGIEHPKTAEAQGQVANYLLRQRRLAEAAALYERAAETITERLGEDNTRLALLLTNLAIARWHDGRREAAVESSARALGIKRKLLPDDHPDLLLSKFNHAHMQALNGEPGPARVLAAEVLQQRRARGDTDAAIDEARGLLAVIAALDGDAVTARREATAVLSKQSPPPGAETFARVGLALVAESEAAPALAREALATSAMGSEPELRARMQALANGSAPTP